MTDNLTGDARTMFEFQVMLNFIDNHRRVWVPTIFPDASPGYHSEWYDRCDRGAYAVWSHLDLANRELLVSMAFEQHYEAEGYRSARG